MIMFMVGVGFLIGAAFLFLVAGSLLYSGGIAAILGFVGFCLLVNWISNLGGKPTHFWPGANRPTPPGRVDQP